MWSSFSATGMDDTARPGRLCVQTRMSRCADDYRVTDYSVLRDDGTFIPCKFRSSSGAGYPIELILAEVLPGGVSCLRLYRFI